MFQWQVARFHLLDNFFEPVHRSLKVRLCLALLRFTAHGENGIKHSLAGRKGRLTSQDFKELARLPVSVLALLFLIEVKPVQEAMGKRRHDQRRHADKSESRK